MEKDTRVIPFQVARLIIRYLQNNLTNSEEDELDEWVRISDDNMEAFDILTEGMDDDVFDPKQLLIETEEATELWIIAGLIVRYQQQIITELEQKTLDDWSNACERNKYLFKQLQYSAFMKKFIVWKRLQHN